MPHNAIEKTLSLSRFNTYRQAIIVAKGADNGVDALKLYEWNAEISSRFFFPLHIYEVTLRNAISEAISMRYGSDWPIEPIFVNSLNGQNRSTLQQALSKGYHGVGKLLPELKFVWFENMLIRSHDGRIWNPYAKQVFPNHPVGLSAAEIRKELKDACYVIRKFRNRCGHHEPIFNNPNLHNIFPFMYESIKWRCLPTCSWLNQKETVKCLLNSPVI